MKILTKIIEMNRQQTSKIQNGAVTFGETEKVRISYKNQQKTLSFE